MRTLVAISAALAVTALGLGGVAIGAPAAKPAAAKPAAGAPSWAVDKAQSRIRFKSAFSGEAFEGGFGRWDAQIAFDPKNLAASKVTVNVDITSVATGDRDRDESLPTADWFNTAKFPKATFVSTAIKSLGGDKYQADGVLTLKGVAKPVSLPFTLSIQGDVAKMSGQTVFNRSQFAIGQGQFAGPDTVPFNVTLTVAVVAKRAA
jgi:polyisoprenoid-binding protein YceI